MKLIDPSRLTPLPAGFGNCSDCAYRNSGTPEICFACAYQKLEALPENGCSVCQLPPKEDESCGNPICHWYDRYFEYNYSIAVRSGVLEWMIKRYKYADIKGWALILGRLLVAFLDGNRATFSRFQIITASPTFVSKSGDGRRWDHTRLVLEVAANTSGSRWPFDLEEPPVIIKTEATTPLVKAKTWRQRKEIAEVDLRDALAVPRPPRTRGKNILVYDDTFTGGFTLREVAKCLIEDGGAKSVSGITIARQVFRGKTQG